MRVHHVVSAQDAGQSTPNRRRAADLLKLRERDLPRLGLAVTSTEGQREDSRVVRQHGSKLLQGWCGSIRGIAIVLFFGSRSHSYVEIERAIFTKILQARG